MFSWLSSVCEALQQVHDLLKISFLLQNHKQVTGHIKHAEN